MRDRLNIFDPDIMKEIESEYSKKKKMADKLARFQTKELVNLIDYYRSTPFDEIETKIKIDANNKFVNIDDDIALRRGLFQNIEKYYEKNNYDFSRLTEKEKRDKITKEVNDYIFQISPEEKERIINNYKTKNYDRYIDIQLNNAKSLFDLFTLITVEEVKDYISLFYDFRIRENLLDARESAIISVAKEKNADLPLSMVDERSIKVVDNESKKIVKVIHRDEKNDSLKERVLEKAKNGIQFIKENSKMATEISALGILAGTVAYMGLYGLIGDQSISTASMIFTSPVVIAGLTVAYKKVLAYDENYAISEAKQTGIFERKENLERAQKRFMDYSENLKKKYLTIEIVGGNNGLHQ